MDPEAQELFKNTKFSERYKIAIWSDIKSLVKQYPNIKYSRYETTPTPCILLQGYAPIQIHGQICILPLNMRLPDNFPRSPPLTEIPFPPNFPFYYSPVLPQNKILNAQYFNWVPMQTTLPKFVGSICQYFSVNPPYDPRNNQILVAYFSSFDIKKGKSTVEIESDAYAQADSYVQELNKKMGECAQVEREEVLAKQCLTSITNKNKQLEQEVKTLEEQCKNKKSTEYNIDPQVEKAHDINTANAALLRTIDELRTQFRQQKIPIDSYLESVKSLHREYFDNFVYPLCN